jgi:hypothetical protein
VTVRRTPTDQIKGLGSCPVVSCMLAFGSDLSWPHFTYSYCTVHIQTVRCSPPTSHPTTQQRRELGAERFSRPRTARFWWACTSTVLVLHSLGSRVVVDWSCVPPSAKLSPCPFESKGPVVKSYRCTSPLARSSQPAMSVLRALP